MLMLLAGGGCGPIWRHAKIGLIFQRNSEVLNTFWRISENRTIVGHRNICISKKEIRQNSNPTDTEIA